MIQNILFFADRLPPLIGGMETHAHYFIEHFTNHTQFPIVAVITKNSEEENCVIREGYKCPIDIQNLSDMFEPAFIFFNSGRWIEDMTQIRKMFPKTNFIYRTGGNEILKAPLKHTQIPDHALRQSYWARSINNSIDLLITNSYYTETRLRELGITCSFMRLVGGVNFNALNSSNLTTNKHSPITIFCAARFVPYKNHSLMLSVIKELLSRKYNLQVRLAGDGPLLPQIKEQVLKDKLSPFVEFLGVLGNKEICKEMLLADIYMQFSTDHVTYVPGGSYIHSECMGRSILEALTAGTFIIAGKSGALSEIVMPDRGLLIEFDDLEQITNKIEYVFEYLPPRPPSTDDFSWQKLFKCYEQLFERM